MRDKIIIKCPNCSSKNIVKAGKKHLKLQTIQRYKCSLCNKFFSDKQLKNKTYNPRIILSAISLYNLGNTLEQTKTIIAKTRKNQRFLVSQKSMISVKFKTPVPITTIQSWITEYKNICTFARLRKQAIKLYKEEMIFSHNLQHNQIYKYQLHKAKLKLQSKELPIKKFIVIKDYLNKIPTNNFPHHIFQPRQEELNELARSSQVKFKTLDFVKLTKQNQANQLANLALNLAKTNKQRHEAIQNFFLINDSTTIATEIPVYLTNDDIKYHENQRFSGHQKSPISACFQKKKFNLNFKNYETPITGHIDLLQIRNGLIHILDYKPEADKINPTEQLTIYALALASRTKLALKDFKCAWFDEKNYYEFFPLHAVYKKPKYI